MRHYCTYFDSNYMLMGLALYESLQEHSNEPFTLWVLCFDDATHTLLTQLQLPNLNPIAQAEFEAGDDALVAVKSTRSKVEYYWTCTPSLPLYVLKLRPEIETITYLDADLYFYSDPEPVYKLLGTHSLMILGHRFPPELQDRDLHGLYNVSWMIFRRDEQGMAALQRWREQCIDWCYARLEDGKFGDQKYLDEWPTRYDKLIVLEHKGAGIAPWNLAQYEITKGDAGVKVDELPLVFYHFHRFRMIAANIFVHGTKSYANAFPTNYLRQAHIVLIYHPYAVHLKALANRYVPGQLPPFAIDSVGKQIQMILQGRAVLVQPRWLAMMISRFALWRSNGAWLVKQGFHLYQNREMVQGRRTLMAAAFRSPGLLLNRRFRNVFKATLYRD